MPTIFISFQTLDTEWLMSHLVENEVASLIKTKTLIGERWTYNNIPRGFSNLSYSNLYLTEKEIFELIDSDEDKVFYKLNGLPDRMNLTLKKD